MPNIVPYNPDNAYDRLMRLPFAFAFVLITAACSGDADSTSGSGENGNDTSQIDDTSPIDDTQSADDSSDSDDAATLFPAYFDVRASAEQVTITGATPGIDAELTNGTNTYTGSVDDLGNLIFRLVEPGGGYTVTTFAMPDEISDEFTVPTLDDHPDAEFFTGQKLEEGLNYIEMRDGTLLSAMVRFPEASGDGPFPTVVEYSGYDPSSPIEEEPAIGIYRALGYATVGVNMRGSGCSGGAFDYFEPLQAIDGYDMIEAIAAQDWVQHNHVGMVGISYSGISQLYVAATQPPSLAAITAISIIEDSYRSTIYPGGIYNNGFAKSWGDARQQANDAFGQKWVAQRAEFGDEICGANQLLRSQNRDLAAAVATHTFYDSVVGDLLSPRTFVDQITVPTLIAGAWQDEQTGGRFATMLDNFTGTDVLKVYLYNGAHADSFGPENLQRASEFMDVYVAEKTPEISRFMRAAASILYEQAFGVTGVIVPDDRFTSLDEARTTIESEPMITVFIEMGSTDFAPGAPQSRSRVTFDSWPPPAAEMMSWSLKSGGALAASAQPNSSVESFVVDVDRSQELTKTGDGEDDANEFDNLVWMALDPANALVYDTAPLSDDYLLAGSGSVRLWISADENDADVQVTISEIRPDGQEMYVQSGWLRASHRQLVGPDDDPDMIYTHIEADAVALPPDEFTEIVVEIFPAGHVFRTGSTIRLTVDSPGGNRNLWAFDVLPYDGSTIYVSLGGTTDSVLELPMMPAPADISDDLPVCGAQRSQPCRPTVTWNNTVVE
jgi:predicted acyl esterase